MSAIFDILGGLLGSFWPYIIAAFAALLGILGLRRGAVVSDRRKREAEALKHRVKTMQEVQGYETEAETQDDQALVDRITRGR